MKLNEIIHGFREDKSIGRWITASEGQRVYDNFEYFVSSIGAYVSECEKRNADPIIIIDGVDSGVSIDLIHTVRSLFPLILEDCEKNNQTAYIIVTANNYELAVDYNCIWLKDLSELKFSSKVPEDYFKFRDLYMKYKQ